MRILGIDPGTIVTGYGLIEKRQSQVVHLENGGIYPPRKQEFSERIFHIYEEVRQLIAKFSPDMIALEEVFVAKNPASALKLGHARGAAMVASVQAGIPLFEYTANEVKLAITGYGHASKEQIQKMVKTLLKLPEVAFTDASDALAVALCHLQTHRVYKVAKS